MTKKVVKSVKLQSFIKQFIQLKKLVKKQSEELSKNQIVTTKISKWDILQLIKKEKLALIQFMKTLVSQSIRKIKISQKNLNSILKNKNYGSVAIIIS